MNGVVVSLNISEKKGTIKKPVASCMFVKDVGIEGDAHSEGGIRQVSLLGQESIDKMTESGVEGLTGGKFAENITTKGIVIYKLPIGTVIHIGATVHEVTKIGKQCHKGCEIQQQTGYCIMPTEGIFTKVVKGGVVNVGDVIRVNPSF